MITVCNEFRGVRAMQHCVQAILMPREAKRSTPPCDSIKLYKSIVYKFYPQTYRAAQTRHRARFRFVNPAACMAAFQVSCG
jgi:hypothetical protein